MSKSPAMWVGLARDDRDLHAILALQRLNLRGRTSSAEEHAQGFVTVEHSLEILRDMHAIAPSIIAEEGSTLAGYALVMTEASREQLPVLDPMFSMFDRLSFRERPIREHRFYVMGQICVAKEHRGRGVFDALYEAHRRHYADRFDLVVTEVATRNQRSMRAHARVGFEVIHTYRDATDQWAVIGWTFS